MSVYAIGSLSAYGLTAVTDQKHRAQDALDLSRGVYWVMWVYFHDRGLVWG